MGLTFQQKFYQVPDIYIVLYSRPDIPRKLACILPKDDIGPETKRDIENAGFIVEEVDFDTLIHAGNKLLELIYLDKWD